MAVSPRVSAVFSYFQNLNLLALLDDLRDGRVARSAWQSDSRLCPGALGLPDGAVVSNLLALGQISEIGVGCDYAARRLGAEPGAVRQFLAAWDEDKLAIGSLVRELEELWQERLSDAEAVQSVLHGADGAADRCPCGSSLEDEAFAG